MIKIFELYKRKAGLDAQSYLSRLTQAAQHLAQAKGLNGWTVQESLSLPARKDIVQLNVPGDVDAFVEIWAANIDAYQQELNTTAGKAWRSARAELVANAKTLVLEEHPLIDVPTPRPPTRNNAFLTRHANFTPEQFQHEWLVGHGEMCKTIPYLKAFVPCLVVGTLAQQDVAELVTDNIEGIAQAYFNTPEEEIAMIKTPEAKLWFAHGAETFGLIKAFGARELVVKLPSVGAA